MTDEAKTRAALALARATQDYAAELVTILDELLQPLDERMGADLPPLGPDPDEPVDPEFCDHDWVTKPGAAAAVCANCGAVDGLVQA